MRPRSRALARRVLSLAAPPEDREALLADLDEEREARARSEGGARAERWYRAQVLRSLAPLLRRRLELAVRRPRRIQSGRRALRPVRAWSDGALELALSVRSLRNQPAYTIAVVATLALALGAHTTVFAVVRSVLFRDRPYPEPERVISLYEIDPEGSLPPGWVSIPNFLDWKDQSESFEHLAVFRGRSAALTGDGEPEYLYSTLVTGEFFEVFDVAPALGRDLTPADGAAGAPPVVVLGHDFWQRRFANDRSILGAEIRLNGAPHTVVGVMPPGFRVPAPWIRPPGLSIDAWLPLPLDPDPARRWDRSFNAVGRLRDGASLPAAQDEMDAVAARLARLHPASNGGYAVRVERWDRLSLGDVRPALLVLWIACGFALLIACANVMNLLLNRLLSRSSELAIRSALGAGRGRIVRLVFTEGLVLATAGAILGLGLGALGLRTLRALDPGGIPFLDQAVVDARVLGVALVAGLFVALVFALVPALLRARKSVWSALRERGRGLSAKEGRHRPRLALALVQLVLSFSLLVGSTLLTRSLGRLLAVPPGLDAAGVLSATVVLSWDRVSTIEERAGFVASVLERLRALPGVDSAGMINSLPFTGSNEQLRFRIGGRPAPEEGREPTASVRGVSPDYFRTLGIPLLRGSDFSSRDLQRPDRAIVNRAFARRFWPDDDALGKSIHLVLRDGEVSLSVAGIVGDVKHFGLGAEIRPEIYRPYTVEYLSSKSFLVRASVPPESLVPAVRGAILDADPDQPIRDIGPMTSYVERSVARPRFVTFIVSGITFVATSLAVLGLFGVFSSWVTERTHEIGLRMALGADRRRIVGGVLARSAGVVLAGVGGGAVVAFALGRTLESLLYGIGPRDPLAHALAFALFLSVTLAASYFPARRASGVDPVRALRHD